MAKPKGGLTKWFKEDWVDIKTGKKCGRKKAKGSKRPYPACRPKAVAAKRQKKKPRNVRRKGQKLLSMRLLHLAEEGKRKPDDP